ncbi:DUF2894 domain-containing protein [Variovorax sp. J22G73]|uniref:DUF2894 domain-containing protein n=1 Tax=unclassified Variovorax TaxID=663243 RepID=UPI000D5FAA98|nr:MULTISPECIES: DUF2894 domain-containing protein [unclassified Variovorax]MDM0102416.1 DUF2894 domain-containing protein [Variovorax sp. J22G73]
MSTSDTVNDAPTFDAGAALAALAALRERGAHNADPVRFRFIEAMARRADAHGGDTRRMLDERIAQLLAVYTEANAANAGNAEALAQRPDAVAAPEPLTARSALAELVEHIAQHAPAPAVGLPSGGTTPELKAVTYFRSTWSKLSAERRLTQSLAKVPDNAGPLNSHHLVHRALLLMRDLSPEYLNRFMSYVDALLWIDQANGSMAAAAASAPRTENTRKTGRGKAA